MYMLCLLLLLPFQVRCQCGLNTVAFVEFGATVYLTSPNFPNDYRPGTECIYQAYTWPGAVVVAECKLDMPTGTTSRCLDYIRIFDEYNYMGQKCNSFRVAANSLIFSLITRQSGPGGRFACELTAGITSNGTNCNCGSTKGLRIVGGVETGVNEFPSIAALFDLSKRAPICGATIIATKWALTAAHCLETVPVNGFALLIGDHNLKKGDEAPETALYRVTNVIQHEAYVSKTSFNDIGLVETHKEIHFTARVGPACLPFSTKLEIGDPLTMAGWGSVSFGGARSDKLLKATVTKIGNINCVNAHPNKFNGQTELCTFQEGKDACQGDSGGPVYYNKDGRQIVVGVVSYGLGCGEESPAVQTLVSAYVKWILEQTPDATYCAIG